MLVQTRTRLGESYTGDESAPRVEVVSEPALGAAADLPATDAEVWSVLEATARALAPRCDVYAIACNTLNVYAPRIAALGLSAELVTPPGAVAAWAADHDVTAAGLLGTRPVASLGEWSPYRTLTETITIEPPPDTEGLHQLILDVKLAGGAAPATVERFVELATGFESTHLLLACTELPLVAVPVEGKQLVDPTELVAAALVRRWSAMRAG